jgi:cytochrome P450
MEVPSSKVDFLSLADPKALQYVLHTSGYNYPKGREVMQSIKLIIGEGIIWAHGWSILMVSHFHCDPSFLLGTTHQRQRKIMNPAFFAPQLKTFLPVFLNSALKVRHLVDSDVRLLKT